MKAAIFDLDDTLVRKEDGEEKTVDSVKKIAEKVSENQNCLSIILTARAETVREETEKLLENKGIKFDKLYMRPETDFTLPDEEYKQHMLEKIRQQNLEISFAFEDKAKVAEMWRKNNIPCFQLPEAHFLKNRATRFLRKLYGKMPSTVQQKYLKLYKKNYSRDQS